MDGYDAITKAREFQPDVILMDLVMLSMDGFEATRQIRQIPALQDVIVIGVSASAFEHTRQQSFAAGCRDFIAKPVGLEDLLEKLRVHLHLEWLYEQTETIQRSQGGEAQENYPRVHLPSAEEIENLFELATSGDLKGLLQQLDRIEQHHTEFSHFTARIREFARSFQINRMCEFLGKYVGEKL